MKQKDLTVLFVSGIVAAVISLLVTQALFGSNKRDLTAEKVDEISAKFNPPDKAVFNKDAVNPTQLIQIEVTDRPSPF